MPNVLAKESTELGYQSKPEFGVTVIVPLLNESAVAQTLSSQLLSLGVDEIIVVDGGSSDGTKDIVLDAGLRVVDSEPGRASQMNAGAMLATSPMLLFLHADTRLPTNFMQELKRADVWGRFDVRFNSQSWAMSVIALFINLRSRISGVCTGDQAIFVRADVFKEIGGFPNLPLMEDVALCKNLRSRYAPYNSLETVTTSARRWQKNGIVKTVLKMWWYRLNFYCGVAPSTFKHGYDDVR